MADLRGKRQVRLVSGLSLLITGIKINCVYSWHDTAAAIIKDGELITAVEKECFNREKHTHAFPVNLINHCLVECGITMHEVDCGLPNWP